MPVTRLIHVLFVAACAVLCAVPTARAADRLPTARPAMHFGEVPGKASRRHYRPDGTGGVPVPRRLRERHGAPRRRRASARRLVLGRRHGSRHHWHVDTYGGEAAR